MNTNNIFYMNNIFKYKYKKYKYKYYNLLGSGMLDIWSNAQDKQTASYIYCIDKGIFHFAVCRKVQENSRVNRHDISTGAAGTDKKYWGKWGSFGGSTGTKPISYLQAAISEINDEAYIIDILKRKITTNDILIPWKPRLSGGKPLLILKLAEAINRTGIFLFEMTDPGLFFKCFPSIDTPIRRSNAIVKSSMGEIDAVCSITTEQIFSKQEEELHRTGNNMFISYFCTTFNDIVKPYLCNTYPNYKHRWANTDLSFIPDTIGRKPSEYPARDREYKN